MEKKVIKKKLEGEVVSDKMDKTVTVLVTTIKAHSKYKKQYKSSKKYKAHDEKNEYKIGDKVVIEHCRPLSKDKRWRVIKKVK
ncbi:30S ribosomal protein S17 [Candidatus Parcubacteria bacterium]|nr:MAG: 30S ribosomal protein S17 [Candidatus Parcubacteria bacterium]